MSTTQLPPFSAKALAAPAVFFPQYDTPPRYDFDQGMPDPSTYPLEALRACADQVIKTQGQAACGYVRDENGPTPDASHICGVAAMRVWGAVFPLRCHTIASLRYCILCQGGSMERIGHLLKKTRTRTFDEGNFRGHTDYLIESDPGARPAPQAFLVHQAPGWVLPPHFHLEEQFQVVTGGDGTLGKHAVAPITVHYTSRETGYGPLVAGDRGLEYLSLRAVTDPGAWYMPESRGKMRQDLRKWQTTLGPIDVNAPAAGTKNSTEILLPMDEDGLAVWLLRLPANAQAVAPPQQVSGGRFHVVVGGDLCIAGEELGFGACVWRDSSDEAMDIRAGVHGLALLVLQFPAQALDVEPCRMNA